MKAALAMPSALPVNLLIGAEWRCLVRNPNVRYSLMVFGLLFVVAAIWAGMAAAEYREQSQSRLQQWEQTITARQALAEGGERSGTPERYAADMAREAAQPAQLPALGGLVLSVRQFDVLGPEIQVSTRTRYSDGRLTDQIFNPLLQEFGLLDLATIMALLLPLLIIALSYGLVQEAREQGIWRLVCAQTARPWRSLFAALGVRLLAVVTLAVLASGLAFVIDPGATAAAWLQWSLIISLYALLWTLIAGLFTLLPVSSGASAAGVLGLWLVLTFVSPAVLAWLADERHPMPSRLVSVIEMRDAQGRAGDVADELRDRWYAAHPQYADVAGRNHPFFVNNVPRDLMVDENVRPIMQAFDEARARQFQWMQRGSWAVPALAVIMAADTLAGIDGPRYRDFTEAVNSLEDRWRAFFVPRIMSYRGVAVEDYRQLPRFDVSDMPPARSPWLIMGLLLLSSAVLAAVFMSFRRRLASPDA